MQKTIDRRSFLKAGGALLALVLTGCASEETQPPKVQNDSEPEESDAPVRERASEAGAQEVGPMQISVTVNGASFTATIEDGTAGREFVNRLPLTLQMEELHGNEKYCHTGESFGGDQFVPGTIEAGDLIVFGSDCLVLFYETFANDGWSYARVGKIDDPTGLADACNGGTVTVAFELLS